MKDIQIKTDYMYLLMVLLQLSLVGLEMVLSPTLLILKNLFVPGQTILMHQKRGRSLMEIPSHIAAFIEMNKRTKLAVGKSWSHLLDGQRCAQLSALHRVEGVACFRVITGHDYLQAHLFKIGLADSTLCPLCKFVRCPSY
ncbi:hypothetical protein TNCV_4320721 [Trichonephila clavipes]|nr:hypothetical protein TNCV_4320721 [Trichonephila clavipes]